MSTFQFISKIFPNALYLVIFTKFEIRIIIFCFYFWLAIFAFHKGTYFILLLFFRLPITRQGCSFVIELVVVPTPSYIIET